MKKRTENNKNRTEQKRRAIDRMKESESEGERVREKGQLDKASNGEKMK